VQPITLPEAGSGSSLGENNVVGTVAGWGTLSSGGSLPDVTQKVDVPIVDTEKCAEGYRLQNLVLSGEQICAGEPGKDSCQGDSGGPLSADGAQRGIVSWGFSCADERWPGVYTDLSEYLDWIEANRA